MSRSDLCRTVWVDAAHSLAIVEDKARRGEYNEYVFRGTKRVLVPMISYLGLCAAVFAVRRMQAAPYWRLELTHVQPV